MSGIASEQETIQKIQGKNSSIISAHQLDEQQIKIKESITALSKMDQKNIQDLAVSTMALQNMKKNDSKSSPSEAQKRLQRKCQDNADEFDAYKGNLAKTLNTLFDKHDLNHDGHLDSEESLVLVNHFVLISKQMMKLSIKSHIMLQVAANIDASMVMNKPLLSHSFITKESLFEDTTAAWFAVLDKHYIPKIDQACDKHGDEMLSQAKQVKDDIFAELDTNDDGSVTKVTTTHCLFTTTVAG